MLNELYKNRSHYLVLFTGLFLGLGLFFGIFGLPPMRIISITLLCIFYFFWGIIHHLLIGDLHIKIVLEYLLISVIACFLLLSLIWRA
jgi:hypothetical protein